MSGAETCGGRVAVSISAIWLLRFSWKPINACARPCTAGPIPGNPLRPESAWDAFRTHTRPIYHRPSSSTRLLGGKLCQGSICCITTAAAMAKCELAWRDSRRQTSGCQMGGHEIKLRRLAYSTVSPGSAPSTKWLCPLAGNAPRLVVNRVRVDPRHGRLPKAQILSSIFQRHVAETDCFLGGLPTTDHLFVVPHHICVDSLVTLRLDSGRASNIKQAARRQTRRHSAWQLRLRLRHWHPAATAHHLTVCRRAFKFLLGQIHSIPYSIPFHSIPFHSIPFHSSVHSHSHE